YGQGSNNFINPWDTDLRTSLVEVLRAKNDCSAWFNQGHGSAAEIMSHVPIWLVHPELPPKYSLNPPDAQTSPDPASRIEVYRWGRFYGDSNNGNLVGGVFAPGSRAARMIILLHELAHKVTPPGFIDDRWSTADSEKNTLTTVEHCKKAVE